MPIYTEAEILRKYEVDFYSDFTFMDVADAMQNNSVFTKDECNEILSEPDDKLQIDRMFFILIYKNIHKLNNFLKTLAIDYPWLRDLLDDNLKSEARDNQIESYRKALLQSDIPKNRDLNIHRCKFLWDIQKYLKSLSRQQYLIIQSKLGFGKRWISSDACTDFSVIRKMEFNIFWMNVSKCTTPDLIYQKLMKLRIFLNPDDYEFKYNNYNANIENEIVNLTLYLRKVLETPKYCECLLVLSDVQDKRTLKAFDLHCKILLTTRHKEILHDIPSTQKKTFDIEHGFTQEESTELLSKALKKKPRLLESEAYQVHKICKGNPFIMSLIAKNFIEFENEPPERRKNRWRKWITALNQYNIQKDEIRYPIEQSLNELTNDYQNLYDSLVIFTDNINIPLKVLQLYWGKSEKETEEIIKKFNNYSLLEINYLEDNHEMVCSMHYLSYSYLTNKIGAAERRRLHKKLVNSYKILEELDKRTEYELNFPEDNYFYFYIGYHLKESQMLEIFPRLFLDIGFLEQKLRITKLPNTLGDLNLYEKEIIGTVGDTCYRRDLIMELNEFLPNVEECIFKSVDSCLLQYAITANGKLQQEAQKQSKKFRNRVWMFDDVDHFHRQRQIVQLPKMPYFLKFQDHGAALIGLIDSNILLIDLSSIYSVEPTFYSGHTGRVKDIQLFENDLFLSLDTNNCINLWSLKHTPVDRRRYSDYNLEDDDGFNYPIARQNNYHHFDVPGKNDGKCLQTIQDSKSPIKCMILTPEYLIYATTEGVIKFYKWDINKMKFEEVRRYRCVTHLPDIHSIVHITLNYIMIMRESGNILFYNLTTISSLPTSKKWTPIDNPLRLHRSYCETEECHIILTVFAKTLVQLKLKNIGPNSQFIFLEHEKLYHDDINVINSSAVSTDSNYIILGTNKGIIVIDRLLKTVILRSNVSDRITCVDICSLDDDVYKYVVLSSTEKGGSVIHMHSLMLADRNEQNMIWGTNRVGSPSSSRTNLNDYNELNTWLLGGHLIDIQANEEKEMTLIAVDSNNRIHYRKSNNFTQLGFISKKYDSKITAICTSSINNIYVGCENGSLKIMGQENSLIMLDESITYLKYFMDVNVLVVGTKLKYRVFLKGNIATNCIETNGSVRDCFEIQDNSNSLLLVKDDCTFDIFNVTTGEATSFNMINKDLAYGSAAYFNKHLIVGAKNSDIHFYRFEVDNSGLTEIVESKFSCITVVEVCDDDEIQREPSSITSLSISPDAARFAVGFEDGLIVLCNMLDKTISRKLKSHNSPVYNLKFSPYLTYPPMILISMSEQIVFWNISDIENNPLQPTGVIRKSGRFSTNKNYKPSNGSPKTLQPDFVVENTFNPWSGKTGIAGKPELLSCIKFIGNSAEKLFTNDNFSRFLTIDDEGNIYHLQLVENRSDNI